MSGHTRGSARSLRPALACCLVLLLALTAGCSQPKQPKQAVELTVSPAATRADEPVTIRVSHLTPGASVELALRSVDAAGTEWTSQASFTADGDGTVEPDRSAPTAGSYLGVFGMGLFTPMERAGPSRIYAWPPSGRATFEFRVREGDRPLASAAITRTMWTQAPRLRTFTMPADGFVGTYVRPAGARRGPAVLVMGGSEGGDPAYGATILAARGIPALSVAYFKAPGLPATWRTFPWSTSTHRCGGSVGSPRSIPTGCGSRVPHGAVKRRPWSQPTGPDWSTGSSPCPRRRRRPAAPSRALGSDVPRRRGDAAAGPCPTPSSGTTRLPPIVRTQSSRWRRSPEPS